jgi:hypothetical protein
MPSRYSYKERVRIDIKEIYPFYHLCRDFEGVEILLTKDERSWVKKTLAENKVVQEFLKKKIKELD